MFVDLNEGHWDPEPPDVDQAESAVLAVASHAWDETEFVAWLRERVIFK